MINFLFSVIAMPLRLLAWLVSVLRIYNALPFLWAAWQLSRDSQDAAAVISLTTGAQGVPAARERARQMFETFPDCQIPATMAWVEITEQGNLQAAENWYRLADSQGILNKYVLLPLKLYLSEHLNTYDKQAIVEEILSRNDLPMEYSRGALLDKAMILLKKKKWLDAEQIADRMLKIEEHPHAIWIKWISGVIKGNSAEAENFINQLRTKGEPGYINGLIALGWFYMGNKRETMNALHEAEKYNVNIEMLDKELAELTKTGEYYRNEQIGEKEEL